MVSLALVAVGCGGEPFSPIGTSDQSIVSGELDTGDPAVVALTVQGYQFCTGTLVSPNVILTAAHCVHEGFTGIPIGAIEIFFGSDISGPGEFIPVTGEGGPHPSWGPNNPQQDFDVGLLRMTKDGPATPIPMATKPFDDTFLGESARIVGFGITMANGDGAGLKRQASAPIVDYIEREFAMEIVMLPGSEIGPGTCNGDSGGPAFLMENGQEVIVGIHSLSDCETLAIDERVDAHVADFIQPFIGESAAECTADGSCAEGCPAVDPDCPCATDGFCATACLDAAMDADCNVQCAAGGMCVSQGCAVPDPDCVPPCSADGQCDATCAADPDCQPVCVADGQCVNGCGTTDPDCNIDPPDDDDDDDVLETEEGCSVATPGSSAGRLGYLAALGLIFAARRRRKAVSSKS